ncbi:helix-turn-helix domain-containing protein [Gordonia sp. NPDC003376]
MTAVSPEPLYTVPDLIDYLQLSRATVYKLLDSGDLRSVRIGRSRRVTQSALNDFLRASESVSL